MVKPAETKAYLNVVAVLKKLPLSERFAAFREAVSGDLKRDADLKLGPSAPGTKSWRRLIGEPGTAGDELPGDDHTELRKGSIFTYVSQPYHLHIDHVRELVEICDKNGLEFTISGMSWYRPADTICVTYTKKGDLLKLRP